MPLRYILPPTSGLKKRLTSNQQKQAAKTQRTVVFMEMFVF
jgi:hypothetical protein